MSLDIDTFSTNNVNKSSTTVLYSSVVNSFKYISINGAKKDFTFDLHFFRNINNRLLFILNKDAKKFNISIFDLILFILLSSLLSLLQFKNENKVFISLGEEIRGNSLFGLLGIE